MTQGVAGSAGDAVERQLREADLACVRQGARLTPVRREVLELVLRAPGPVGAYPLLDQLRERRRGAAPPTVYRALEFLVAQGLVHRLERLNAFVGCAGDGHAHRHPAQFLICRVCQAVREIDDSAVAATLRGIAAAQGFSIERATVEVEGVCAACAAQSLPSAVASR